MGIIVATTGTLIVVFYVFGMIAADKYVKRSDENSFIWENVRRGFLILTWPIWALYVAFMIRSGKTPGWVENQTK